MTRHGHLHSGDEYERATQRDMSVILKIIGRCCGSFVQCRSASSTTTTTTTITHTHPSTFMICPSPEGGGKNQDLSLASGSALRPPEDLRDYRLLSEWWSELASYRCPTGSLLHPAPGGAPHACVVCRSVHFCLSGYCLILLYHADAAAITYSTPSKVVPCAFVPYSG